MLGDEGRSVPAVEGGENLGPTLAAAKRNRPEVAARNVEVSIDEVAFVDTGHAAVLYSICVDGNPVLTNHRGDAVAMDGVWKVARSTFCELMGMAGVPCPPPDPQPPRQ